MTSTRVTSASVADTRRIAAEIAGLARPGDVILLIGEMGSGKTAFAQGFGAALGVDEPITSPTFTLVHTYDGGRIPLHHADLYRLDLLNEVADLALGELVEDDGILLVEWGEAAADLLGDHLAVEFATGPVATGHAASDMTSDEHRVLTVSMVGEAWVRRWSRLEAALATWREVD